MAGQDDKTVSGRFSRLLAARTSGQSLALFRMGFGFVMLATAWELLASSDGPSKIDRHFVASTHLLSYPGLEWLAPLPPPWIHLVCGAVGVFAVLLTIGLFARLAAAGVFVTWTYLFLLDVTYYNNHYYLQSILAFLFIFLPSSSVWSVDRWRQRREPVESEPGLVPFWAIFLLRAQVSLVYFFGGVTKINGDYLVHAQPMKLTLANSSLAGLAPALATNDLFAYFLSYTGLLFDLAVAPLLLARRTRITAILLTVIFHGINELLLFRDIGWYPLLGLIATTIFLDPDWPTRFARWMTRPAIARPDRGWLLGGFLLVPGIGAAMGWKLAPTAPWLPPRGPGSPWRMGAILVWLALGILVPLRHLVIPGDVNWTEQGAPFSWRMKASAKVSGHLLVRVEDPELSAEPDELIYRDVDARRLDWAELPELMVVYDRLLGKRILYNRLAGGRSSPRSEIDAAERVSELWRTRFERPVKTLPARSFDETVRDIEAILGEAGATSRHQDTLADIHANLAETLDADQDEYRFKLSVLELRQNFLQLVQDPEVQSKILFTLTLSPPFGVSQAGDVAPPVLYIGDGESWRGQTGPPIARGHAAFADGWDTGSHVWIDVERFTVDEFAALPGVVAFEDRKGERSWMWNPLSEMNRRQVWAIGSQPLQCHRYVAHVAERWKEKYGRRPAVHVDTMLKLNQWAAQPVIDPTVDLASAPIRYWSENPWIVPHRRILPAAGRPATAQGGIGLGR